MSRLDPGISLATKPVQMESPADVVGRVLTMRDFLTTEELKRQQIATGQENARRIGLENQALERKNAGDKLQNEAVQQATSLDPDSGAFSVDHDKVEAMLIRGGFPEHALAYSKMRKEIEDNSYNAITHQLDLGSKRAENLGKMAQSVLNADPSLRPQLWPAAITQAKTMGLVDDATLQKFGVSPQYVPGQTEQFLQQLSDAAAADPYGRFKARMDEKRAEAKEGRDIATQKADITLKGAQTEHEQAETQKIQAEAGAMPQTAAELKDRILGLAGGDTNNKIYQSYSTSLDAIRRPVPVTLNEMWKKAQDEFEKVRMLKEEAPAKIAEAAAVEQARAPGRIAEAVAVEKAKAGNDPRLEKVPPNLHKDVLDKVQKANDDWNTAQQASDDMRTFIDQIRAGNKQASAYLDTEGVLTLNTGRGVKRVNSAEIGSYGNAGSIYDRIVGALKKGGEGIGQSDSIINDIERLHQQVTGNAQQAYQRKLKSINQTYQSDFQPSIEASQPVASAPASGTDMITVQIPGQPPGQIHATQWDAFKKKYPNAERK